MNRHPLHSSLVEIAREFWQPLVRYRTYPIDIERAVAVSSLPIIITLLPNLTVKDVQKWIIESGYSVRIPTEDKHLHGFLLALKGQGVIFVNGTDTHQERRFTIAHEVAHFLLDYQLPRRRFIESFGESIVDLLDGERSPSIEERISFITSEIPSPFTTHHLDSQELAIYESNLVWKAEERTDALAIELLAPYLKVISLIPEEERNSFKSCFEYASTILYTTFALPRSIVLPYAKLIAKNLSNETTLFEEWGLI